MIIKGSGRNIIPFFYARKLPVAGAALSNNVWLSLSFDADPHSVDNVWLSSTGQTLFRFQIVPRS